jgi:hypothetical protein
MAEHWDGLQKAVDKMNRQKYSSGIAIMMHDHEFKCALPQSQTICKDGALL